MWKICQQPSVGKYQMSPKYAEAIRKILIFQVDGVKGLSPLEWKLLAGGTL